MLDNRNILLDNRNLLLYNRNLLLDNRNLLLDSRNLDNSNLLLDNRKLLPDNRNLLLDNRNLLLDNRNLLLDNMNLLPDDRSIVNDQGCGVCTIEVQRTYTEYEYAYSSFSCCRYVYRSTILRKCINSFFESRTGLASCRSAVRLASLHQRCYYKSLVLVGRVKASFVVNILVLVWRAVSCLLILDGPHGTRN